MENLLVSEKESDLMEILLSFDGLSNPVFKIQPNNILNKIPTLSSVVNYVKNAQFNYVEINEDICNKKVYKIALDLANAVDKNSVSEIKYLKSVYGDTDEFAIAKNFLNKKVKEIWNVFDNKNKKLILPYEAMKTLGITNKPTLESLLDDSIKYFEKDNGSTTVQIINSILNNPNLDYSFDVIFEYLKTKYNKENTKYNFVTVEYLSRKLQYDKNKLTSIGVEKSVLKKLFKTLSIKEKLKFLIKYYIYTKPSFKALTAA